MRKVDDGEEKKEKKRREEKKGKIITFIVATNVVASRPPKRRPTGKPHARANIFFLENRTRAKKYQGKTSVRCRKSVGLLFPGCHTCSHFSR